MKKHAMILALGCIPLSQPPDTDFLTEQRKHARVREAFDLKLEFIESRLRQFDIGIDSLHILMVAFKDSDRLDIYAKSKEKLDYQKVFSYEICMRSGGLGPKRKQGDGQVPEGFYHISRFNPNSNYHLSLGISYPNPSDRIKSKAVNLGGDIFIHGACASIGCLPMTDFHIREIYVLAVLAANNGQTAIPVYLFPFEMTAENIFLQREKMLHRPELVPFWANLKTGYDRFIQQRIALEITVTDTGNYAFGE